MRKSYLKAIENIKQKGFTHFKAEFEANLDRGDADSECYDCDGQGYYTCSNCEGDGFVYEMSGAEDVTEETPRVECYECSGEGDIECYDCSGRGRERGVSVDDCYDYILENVKQETRDALVYSKFYEDGSVDSEYTFTLPIEKAHLALDVMEVFKKLASEYVGNGMELTNAGMHLSLLPSGNYPCARGLLDSKKMANFRSEVTKLLPALYFAASHKSTTRSLEYRMPRVSNDDKYSAIYTHGDTSIEYRVFDTCYDKPDSLLDKIEVMAQTLEYYSDKKVDVKYKTFNFNHSRELSNLYQELENLTALEETIKLVKPAKSFDRMKKERNFSVNKRALAQMLKDRRAKSEKAWHKYMERFDSRLQSEIMSIIEDQKHRIRRAEENGVFKLDKSLAEMYLRDWGIMTAYAKNKNLFDSYEKAKPLIIKEYGLQEKPLDLDSFIKQEEGMRDTYYKLQIA